MKPFVRGNRKVLAAVGAIVLVAVATWAAYTFAYTADQMDWDCGGGSCATNDPRSFAMPLALLGTVGAVLLSGYAVGLIGPAITIALPAWFFRMGVLDAVEAGFSPEGSVTAPMVVTTIALIVAAVCAVAWIPMLLGDVRVRRRVRERERSAA